MTESAIDRITDGILGKPFEWLGRGPDRFYCLGIWLFLVEAARGIWIDDPFDDPTPERLKNFWSQFNPVNLEDLQPFDLLFWRWGPNRQPHVATVLNEKWAASIDRGTGVYRISLREASRLTEKAYRLRRLE